MIDFAMHIPFCCFNQLDIFLMCTYSNPEKRTVQTEFQFLDYPTLCEGYEIHMGVSTVKGDPFCELTDGTTDRKTDGCVRGNVFGTYLHGLFDTGELTETLIRWLAQRKGIDPGEMTIIPHETYVQQQYDILADGVRKVLDMDKIYEIMGRYEIADKA